MWEGGGHRASIMGSKKSCSGGCHFVSYNHNASKHLMVRVQCPRSASAGIRVRTCICSRQSRLSELGRLLSGKGALDTGLQIHGCPSPRGTRDTHQGWTDGRMDGWIQPITCSEQQHARVVIKNYHQPTLTLTPLTGIPPLGACQGNQPASFFLSRQDKTPTKKAGRAINYQARKKKERHH